MRLGSGAIPESVFFVEDNKGGNHPRHPSASRQQQDNQDAPASSVQNGEGRKQDGEQDLQ